MDTTAQARLSRDDTARAYEKHLVAKGNYSGAWDSLADLFADDATYTDVFYGQMKGKPAIRKFLLDSMKGIEDWSFPVQWTVIEEGRVVVHWLNRLPKQRPDGSWYEFPGLSVITYDSRGLISSQMDLYDGITTLKVIVAYKTGGVGRALSALFGWIGPVGREITRGFYALFGAKPK